jgi:regulatory protein
MADPALSAAWIRRHAQRHLQRYWPSVAQLRRVLVRKVDRVLAREGGDRAAVLARVEDVLAELLEQGALDDTRFVRAWVEELHRKGHSRRAIEARMATRGVERGLVEAALADRPGEDPELAAARAYARRRRLGPHRSSETRRDRRDKDIAALCRAGFGLGLALRVVDEDDGGGADAA